MKGRKLAVTTRRQNWSIRQKLAHTVHFSCDLWHFRYEIQAAPKRCRANDLHPRGGNIQAATLMIEKVPRAESDPKPARSDSRSRVQRPPSGRSLFVWRLAGPVGGVKALQQPLPDDGLSKDRTAGQRPAICLVALRMSQSAVTPARRRYPRQRSVLNHNQSLSSATAHPEQVEAPKGDEDQRARGQSQQHDNCFQHRLTPLVWRKHARRS